MSREFSYGFYHSKLWKDVRKTILMRDNYLCRHCNKPAQEVHHIIHLNPDNINDQNVTINPNNLISLCKDCHFKEHYTDKGNGHRKVTADVLPSYSFDENGYVISPLSSPR